jgi:hypothetical protein
MQQYAPVYEDGVWTHKLFPTHCLDLSNRPLRYPWRGHISRRLDLIFAYHGKVCPERVKELVGHLTYQALAELDSTQLRDESYRIQLEVRTLDMRSRSAYDVGVGDGRWNRTEPLHISGRDEHINFTVYAEEDNDCIAVSATVETKRFISDVCLSRCIQEARKVLCTMSCPHPTQAPAKVDDVPKLSVWTRGVLRQSVPSPGRRNCIMVAMTDKDRQARLLAVGTIDSQMGMVLKDCCLPGGLAQMESRLRAKGSQGTRKGEEDIDE